MAVHAWWLYGFPLKAPKNRVQRGRMKPEGVGQGGFGDGWLVHFQTPDIDRIRRYKEAIRVGISVAFHAVHHLPVCAHISSLKGL